MRGCALLCQHQLRLCLITLMLGGCLHALRRKCRWQAAAAGGGLHLQHSGAAWHLQAAGMTRQRVVSGVAAPQQQLAAVSSSMVSIIPPSSMPGGMLQQSTAASSAVAASLPAGAIDIGMGSPSSGMLGMPPMSAPVYASPYHMMGPGGGVQYMPLQVGACRAACQHARLHQHAAFLCLAPATHCCTLLLAGHVATWRTGGDDDAGREHRRHAPFC